jgi:(4S)-4-hydroxy-5-phosphonooxypentane-2,3-dione isomerase
MLIHTAHLVCRPEVVEAFRLRLERHARISIAREEACHRFDVYQETHDPTLFFLYEVYADEAALEAHRASEHYKSFRADTAEWVTGRTWWFWQSCSSASTRDATNLGC